MNLCMLWWKLVVRLRVKLSGESTVNPARFSSPTRFVESSSGNFRWYQQSEVHVKMQLMSTAAHFLIKEISLLIRVLPALAF